jgi:hypothetical protein
MSGSEKDNDRQAKRLDNLEKKLEESYRNFGANKKKDKSKELAKLIEKMSEIEKALSKISKNGVVKVSASNKGLESSFEKLYKKMEDLAKASRPRLTPYPS